MRFIVKLKSFVFLYMLSVASATACTSFIISGRATKDGRPIIFKNRDTGTLSNITVLLQGEKYRFVGIANARDTLGREIWGGHNEKGFAIMNTAAYNLNKKDEKSSMEGETMRRALEICATLQDFEQMLDTMARPLSVNANFGVLDAQGGCAYYETGNNGYVKYDANDPAVAPQGYLLRTNHGMSGDRTRDQGVERFFAIRDFMKAQEAPYDAEELITQVPRHLHHGLTGVDLRRRQPLSLNDTTWVDFRDFIPRHSTASSLLVQGVKAGEPAAYTTSWTIIGFPLTCVAIPVLITPSGQLPTVILPGEKKSAWLATQSLRLKARLFSLPKGNSKDYINLAQLTNQEGTGIMQQLHPLEQEIMTRGCQAIAALRTGNGYSALDEYYQWVDDFLHRQFPQE